MILVDGFSMARRFLHVAESEAFSEFKKRYKAGDVPVKDEYLNFRQIWLHMTLIEILDMKKKFNYTYGELIMTFDSKYSWRHRYLKSYKWKRKANQSDYDKFVNSAFNNMLPDLYKILDAGNIRMVKDVYVGEYGVEGEDICYTLLTYYKPNENHLIVSEDSDFIQCLR